MLEKYEELYGRYPKSPYAGGFRGSIVAFLASLSGDVWRVFLSPPTQGEQGGLYHHYIYPPPYHSTDNIIHHIIGIATTFG